MSKTVAQIFAINPTTVVADTDLYYLVQSPYTPGTDAAITGASLKAVFGTGGTVNPGLINQLAYYAASGSAISGLSTLANGALVTSAGGVPSISQTLPNAVQDNITRLGTIANIGSPLGGTFGGTGVNNGVSTITIGGSVTFSGAFTFTGTLTGITSVTFPTSGTLATTAQLPTPAALTKTDDTNVTLTLGGTPATALLQATSLTLGWTGQLGLTRGGTNASLTASNGGIIWSNATQFQILAGTATAGQMLRSGATATPAWSTATFPATGGASGNVLISDATNYIASTSLWPNTVGTSGKVVISNGTANVYSTPTFPNASATTRKIIVSDGTNWVASTETYAVPGSANNIMTSDGTNWTSSGTITTSSITFSPTTGGIVGTTTNDDAAAGRVGEFVSSVISSGAAVSLTNNVIRDITSISLTKGDWDLWGNVSMLYSTFAGAGWAWISTTSATLPDASLYCGFEMGAGSITSPYGITTLPIRLSLSVTTTVYLSLKPEFASGTATGCGGIYARRVR